MPMRKYRSVVFLDGGSSDEPFGILVDAGIDDLFEYLLQWEYGDSITESSVAPWGMYDSTYETTDGDLTYVVSYNWSLSYVSLTEVIDK